MRIILAIIGGIIAALIVSIIEGSTGGLTYTQLAAMLGAIALILFLTSSRFQKSTFDSRAELLGQLEHHRRELYRLTARHQRKGSQAGAEISAWFRNKRALNSIRRQLQRQGISYQPDAIDTAPPPTANPIIRIREFLRQPAVTLFILTFLISLVLAYPLTIAAQSLLRSYLPTLMPLSVASAPTEEPAAAADPTDTARPPSPSPTSSETPEAASATADRAGQASPSPTATQVTPTPPPTNTAALSPTRTTAPSPTRTAASSPTITAMPTATPSPTTADATPSATPTATSSRTPTATPSPAAPPSPLPSPIVTPTFIPAPIPASCNRAVWESESNNTFEDAQGPLSAGTTYCGRLDDAFDFYFMEFTTPGQLTVVLQNGEIEPGTPPLNLLKFFTADEEPIDWCCLSRQSHIDLTINVNIGRYYILVDNREIVGIPYILTINYEP